MEKKKLLNLEKNKFRLYLIAILLFFFLAFSMGILFERLISDGFKCLKNPLNYGIDKFNEVNKENYICNCYGEKSFNFNSTFIDLKGLEQIYITQEKEEINIPNYSDILKFLN